MKDEGIPKTYTPLYFLTPDDGKQVGVVGIQDGELIIEQSEKTGIRNGKLELSTHFQTDIREVGVNIIPDISLPEIPDAIRLVDKELVHPNLVYGTPFVRLQEDGEETEDSLHLPVSKLLYALRNPYHTAQFKGETADDTVVTCVIEKSSDYKGTLLVFGTSGDGRIENSVLYYKEFVIDLAETLGYQRHEVDHLEVDIILDFIQAKVAEISPVIKEEYGVEPSPVSLPEGSYFSPRSAPTLLVYKSRTGPSKQQVICENDGSGFFVIGKILYGNDHFEQIDGITGGYIVGVDGMGRAMYLKEGNIPFLRPKRVDFMIHQEGGGVLDREIIPHFWSAKRILHIDGRFLLIDDGHAIHVVRGGIAGSGYQSIKELGIGTNTGLLNKGSFVQFPRNWSWQEAQNGVYKVGHLNEDVVVKKLPGISEVIKKARSVRYVGTSKDGDHVLFVNGTRVVIFKSGVYEDNTKLLDIVTIPFDDDAVASDAADFADSVLCAFDNLTGHVIVAKSDQMNPADIEVIIGFIGNIRENDDIQLVTINLSNLPSDKFPRDTHLSIAGMYPYHKDDKNGFIIVFNNGQSCLVRVPMNRQKTSIRSIAD